MQKFGGANVKYPCLVPRNLCTTPVHIVIEQEGLNKYGEPLEAVEVDANCNYQDSAKAIYTEDRKTIQISGIAIFPGDIVPELPTISGGTVVVFGEERKIIKGEKARNPDGSVNYCRLYIE